jgi:hypothetical protein
MVAVAGPSKALPWSAVQKPFAIANAAEPVQTKTVVNELTLPGLKDTLLGIGKPVTLPILGPVSVYAVGRPATITPGAPGFGDLGVFASKPLSPAEASVAGLTTLAGVVAGVAPNADAMVGALLHQGAAIQTLINDPAFKKTLPQGAKVTPMLFASGPSTDLLALALKGQEPEKVRLGLGIAITFPAVNGPGKAGQALTVMINSTGSYKETADALRNPGARPYSRTVVVAVIANGVPVPKLGPVNIGPGVAVSARVADPKAPWTLKTPDGATSPMPPAVARAMNALMGTRSPISEIGPSLADFAGKLGFDPKTLETAGRVAGPALDVAGKLAPLALIPPILNTPLGRKLGPAGPIGAIAGVVEQIGSTATKSIEDADREAAVKFVEDGEHVPTTSLVRRAQENGSTAELLHLAKTYSQAVDVALDQGRIPASSLHRLWSEMARYPFGLDMTRDDVARIRLVAAAVLGRSNDVERLAKDLNDPVTSTSGEPARLPRSTLADFTPVPVSGANESGMFLDPPAGSGGVPASAPRMKDRYGQVTPEFWLRDATGGPVVAALYERDGEIIVGLSGRQNGRIDFLPKDKGPDDVAGMRTGAAFAPGEPATATTARGERVSWARFETPDGPRIGIWGLKGQVVMLPAGSTRDDIRWYHSGDAWSRPGR